MPARSTTRCGSSASGRALRRYAAEHGIRLIGDIPIYVAEDSAETAVPSRALRRGPRRRRRARRLAPRGAALGAAGLRLAGDAPRGLPLVDRALPPDAGARRRRAGSTTSAASSRTGPCRAARRARSRAAGTAGPGAALFEAVERELGRLPLIAEDLGIITPAVDRLRSEFGLLGMRIVGRGFVKRHRHRHAVAAHVEDAVVYTGTHDHPTLAGWLATASAGRSRARARTTSRRPGSRTTTSSGRSSGSRSRRARGSRSCRCRTCSGSAPRRG